MSGIPVVVSNNGRGLPVKQVASGAPVMTIAANGRGIPIVISNRGIPFVVQGLGPPTLATLTLSGTLRNGVPSSGSILGATAGSTIASNVTGLTVNSGARTYTFDGTGAAGTTANGLVETLVGATGSPKNSSITVAAAYVLGTLTLSGSLTNGSASSGTIIGATTGSTITSNVTGLTVNSVARTYSFDGSAAAGTTANGLVETLTGATGSPKNSSLTVGSAAGTINAPVITQTSTPTATPFTWSVAEDATFFPGDFWHVQRATGTTTTDASNNLTAGTLNGEAIQQITQGDLVDNATITFVDLVAAPAGPLALRLRVGQEDGAGGYVWGPWSNVLTDTLAAVSTAELQATSGVNKSQYIDTTGTPRLTASMNNHLGATCPVRATLAASGKRHWEVTLVTQSTNGSNYTIGVGDAGTAIGPAVFTNRPGNGTDQGFSINVSRASTNVDLYYNGAYQSSPNLIGAGVVQMGDLFVIEFDTTANTASIWHSRAGTHLLLATFTLTSLIPTNWSAQVAGYSNLTNPDAMTVNFGATAFAKTPTSGYSFYG